MMSSLATIIDCDGDFFCPECKNKWTSIVRYVKGTENVCYPQSCPRCEASCFPAFVSKVPHKEHVEQTPKFDKNSWALMMHKVLMEEDSEDENPKADHDVRNADLPVINQAGTGIHIDWQSEPYLRWLLSEDDYYATEQKIKIQNQYKQTRLSGESSSDRGVSPFTRIDDGWVLADDGEIPAFRDHDQLIVNN